MHDAAPSRAARAARAARAVLALGALGLLGAGPPPGEPDAPPAPPPAAHHVYGVRVFTIGAPASEAADDAFVATQLARANGLFAGIDTAFEVIATERLPASAGSGAVTTRADRDALGHARWQRGVIDVYIVNRLYDVDAPLDEMGERPIIRGVHWRDRAAKEHRWIIVWRGAPEHVLAHELGHFFGLPHGTDPASIMNKSPRSDPPPEARGFVPAELATMRAAERRMRRSGFLRDRVVDAP